MLLDLQSDIAQLERELDRLDTLDAANDDGERLLDRALDNRQPRRDGRRPRSEVMQELRTKLVEYDELLIKARELAGFQRPSTRDYRSVRTWFWSANALVERDAMFIRQKEDIVSLRSGREWSSFDGWVERCLRKCDCGMLRVSDVHIENKDRLTNDRVSRNCSARARCAPRRPTRTSSTTARSGSSSSSGY